MEQVLGFTGMLPSQKYDDGCVEIDTHSSLKWITTCYPEEKDYNNAYGCLGTMLLYVLTRIGVDEIIVESLVPQLYELYNTDVELRLNEEAYRYFQEDWQDSIDRWRELRDRNWWDSTDVN